MVNPAGAVFGCGATVIHNEWAMTAAHCTANRVTIVIRAGANSLTRPERIFETTEYYNHPLYIEQLAAVQPNDIGVIKFGRSIEYTDLIKPIRLQSSYDMNKNYAGIRLQASGWGNVWTGGPSPEVLNWVYLVGTSNFECWMAFGGNPIIVASTICAGHYNVTSQSTCQGDSGGPLVTIDSDGVETQVGISSFVSQAGCHAGFPAGFIRPGHYHDWLYEVTGINFDWDPNQVTTVTPETTTTEEDVTTTVAADTTTTAEETTTTAAEETTTTPAEETTTTAAEETTTTAAEETTTTTTAADTTTTEAEETTTQGTTEAPESESDSRSSESDSRPSESDSRSSESDSRSSETDSDEDRSRPPPPSRNARRF
ncbi:collagenase-like [Epargyreus clarus]|uniref:collagenase-like n=1 Tax=Epargyreus clarus TaxID=520877 RepID=UPI003C2EA2F0